MDDNFLAPYAKAVLVADQLVQFMRIGWAEIPEALCGMDFGDRAPPCVGFPWEADCGAGEVFSYFGFTAG